jgi:hypothetical protein
MNPVLFAKYTPSWSVNAFTGEIPSFRLRDYTAVSLPRSRLLVGRGFIYHELRATSPQRPSAVGSRP